MPNLYMNKETLIEKAIGIIHGILSHFAEKKKDKYLNFREEIKIRFGFEKKFDWNILLNAIYVFQDTELAKSSFNKFYLQGPCKHYDVGERYLRLYGFLNAINLQQIAIENLVEIFKLPQKQKIIQEIKELKIVQLRNKASAHLPNYAHSENDAENKFHVYEISRPALESDQIHLLLNQETFEKYDMVKDIEDFDSMVVNLLFQACMKLEKKIFNNQSKFFKKLNLLKEEINGNIVKKKKN